MLQPKLNKYRFKPLTINEYIHDVQRNQTHSEYIEQVAKKVKSKSWYNENYSYYLCDYPWYYTKFKPKANTILDKVNPKSRPSKVMIQWAREALFKDLKHCWELGIDIDKTILQVDNFNFVIKMDKNDKNLLELLYSDSFFDLGYELDFS